MKDVLLAVTVAVIVLSPLAGCSALTKKPFMCCATKTTVRCTQEVPVDEVAVGNPGEICAVSTDLLKAQTTAQTKSQ